MIVTEYYTGVLMGANTSLALTEGRRVGGFLCKVTGTITITNNGATVVDAVPVTAGIYTPLPFEFPRPGLVVTLAGGAAGTLAT